MGSPDIQALAESFVLGAVLGAVSIGSLWLSTRRLVSGRFPWFQLFASFALRMGLIAAALILISRGDPLRTAMTLPGFIATRILLIRRIATSEKTAGSGHAHQSG